MRLVNRRIIGRLCLILLGVFLGVQLFFFSQVVWLKSSHPHFSSFMEHHLDELRQQYPYVKLQHQWRDFPVINPSIMHAVIAAEDSGFMDNNGFDWQGIRTAFEKNLEAGKLVAGGSTITQQLAKNIFLSGRRSFIRKGEEALITVMIDLTLSKRRVLELYLNYAQWGQRVFGIEAASQHYYGISASQLSKQQAARLAAMLPSPALYDRQGDTQWLQQKTAIILKRMPLVTIPK